MTDSGRSRLLSEHIRQHPVWGELVTSLDEVWANLGLDNAIDKMKWLRSPINTRDLVISDGGKLVNMGTLSPHDRTTLIQSADLLGFRFHDSSMFTSEDYIRFCRFLAQYYNDDKGMPIWSDFLSWMTNAEFRTAQLWTTDYVDFYEEDDPAVGTPIHEGGDWYPTTHILIEYDASRFDLLALREFFNYFSNINLVLQFRGQFNASIRAKASTIGLIRAIYPGAPSQPAQDNVVNLGDYYIDQNLQTPSLFVNTPCPPTIDPANSMLRVEFNLKMTGYFTNNPNAYFLMALRSNLKPAALTGVGFVGGKLTLGPSVYNAFAPAQWHADNPIGGSPETIITSRRSPEFMPKDATFTVFIESIYSSTGRTLRLRIVGNNNTYDTGVFADTNMSPLPAHQGLIFSSIQQQGGADNWRIDLKNMRYLWRAV